MSKRLIYLGLAIVVLGLMVYFLIGGNIREEKKIYFPPVICNETFEAAYFCTEGINLTEENITCHGEVLICLHWGRIATEEFRWVNMVDYSEVEVNYSKVKEYPIMNFSEWEDYALSGDGEE